MQPGCMMGWGKYALSASPRSFEWRNYKRDLDALSAEGRVVRGHGDLDEM